jgi:hypothetical protein
MSYFDSDVDCPQCGFVRALNSSSRDNETTICGRCGYFIEQAAEIDAGGEYVRDKDDRIVGKTVEQRGFGAWHIRTLRGGGRVGTINDPLLPSTIEWFTEALANPDVDAGASYLTRWDEARGGVVLVAGNWNAQASPHREVELRREDAGSARCGLCDVTFAAPAGERAFGKDGGAPLCAGCRACAEGGIRLIQILPEGASWPAGVRATLRANADYKNDPASGHFLCSQETAELIRSELLLDALSENASPAYIESDDPADGADLRRALERSAFGNERPYHDADSLLQYIAPALSLRASAIIIEAASPATAKSSEFPF